MLSKIFGIFQCFIISYIIIGEWWDHFIFKNIIEIYNVYQLYPLLYLFSSFSSSLFSSFN